MKLPYHVRINIKEPRETEFADLKRRKNERFEDYQIRVHFDYLDRREFYEHLFRIKHLRFLISSKKFHLKFMSSIDVKLL